MAAYRRRGPSNQKTRAGELKGEKVPDKRESKPESWFTMHRTIAELSCLPEDTVRLMLDTGQIRYSFFRPPKSTISEIMVHRSEIDRILMGIKLPPAQETVSECSNSRCVVCGIFVSNVPNRKPSLVCSKTCGSRYYRALRKKQPDMESLLPCSNVR